MHTAKLRTFYSVTTLHYKSVNIPAIQNMENCKNRSVLAVQFTVSD